MQKNIPHERAAHVRPQLNKRDKRLSWEDTFREMAKEREDWSDLDATVADGLAQERKW